LRTLGGDGRVMTGAPRARRRQRGDAVDDVEVHAPAPHQRVRDLQRLLAGEDIQGCSVRKGELKTPNNSGFLIRRVSSSPFLAKPPCV
jgi:hypothetical protein